MNRREFTRNVALATGALGFHPLTRIAQAQIENNPTIPVEPGTSPDTGFASGIVTGVREGRKFPLPAVRVSNGRDIVKTDRLGRYKLAVSEGDIIFVIKPRDYALPLNESNLPQFYRIHSPQGSPKQKYPGIAPTGPLPSQINFTLTAQKEADDFRVVLFGDTQSRSQEDIGFMMRHVISDVAGEKAAFGISLGDLAFNTLEIYQNHNRAVATLGLPWYNLPGNHDLNFDTPTRTHSLETYKSLFGPPYYSFDVGATHFVVLDNVAYEGSRPDGREGPYHTELGAAQLQWLEKDLALVPASQLVVLMMHIPLKALEGDEKASLVELQQFFRIIEKHPHCLSISAHTHFQQNLFYGKDAGFNGAGEHHHFNSGAVCGSWWDGMHDQQDIPHATMRDGTPNGYSFLNIKGNRYTLDYKVARRAADYQMNIYAPIEVARADLGKTEVLANIFAGSQRSKVEMQVSGGEWIPMQLTARRDPGYVACKAAEDAIPKKVGRTLPKAVESQHIWSANLPANLPTGGHLIGVRNTDMWGRIHNEYLVMRVA